MLWLVALVVVLPLLSIDLLMVSLLYEGSLYQADHFLASTAGVFRAQLHTRAHTQRDHMARLVGDPRLAEALRAGEAATGELQLWAQRALAAGPSEEVDLLDFSGLGFDRIQVLDATGGHMLASEGVEAASPLPPPPMREPHAAVTRLLVMPALTLCTSGWITDGTEILGALVVGGSMRDDVLRRESHRTGGHLALVQDGVILARSSNWIGEAGAAEALDSLRQLNPEGMSERVPSRTSAAFRGEEYRLLAETLPLLHDAGSRPAPLFLLAGVELSRFTQPIAGFQNTIFVITALSALLAVALAALLFHHVVLVPIQRLARVTRRVAAGNLTQRIPVSGRDEISELARSFNVMTTRLQGFYNTLEQLVHERTEKLRHSLLEAEEARYQLVRSNYLIRAYSEFVVLLNTIDVRRMEQDGLEALARMSESEMGVLVTRRRGIVLPRAEYTTDLASRRLLETLIQPGGWLGEVEQCDGMSNRMIPAEVETEPGGTGRSFNVLGFPLRFGSESLGALVLASSEPYPEDVCLFLANALRQLSVALSNALAVERIRRQTHELERANAELQRAGRTKSEFVASMSHELRTPMNAILGFSRVLMDEMLGPLNSEQKDKLSRIYERGRDLLSLINSILDLSQIEAGRMRLNLQEVDLAAAVRGVFATLEPLAAAKGLQLESELPPEPPRILADPVKIDQVLMNLVGNAVKFTAAGHVGVTVAREQIGGYFLPAGWVGLCVSDSGIGIARENQDRIFDSFTQVDGSDSREYGGTGLGLAITRRLVEMHGGMISVDSALNRGARFTVILPPVPPQRDDASSASSPEGQTLPAGPGMQGRDRT